MLIIYKMAQMIVMTLPVKAAYRFAEVVADVHYFLSKKDRDMLTQNLMRVFIGDEKHARSSAREIMRNFAKYLVEFLRFSKMDKEYIKKHVIIEGIENLDAALKTKKGVVAFSAHLGNWEWGAALIAQLGYPISVIALAHKNKSVNKLFINQRAIQGVKNVALGGSIRKSIKLLAKNEVIGILSDRDFSNNSVRVNFLGSPADLPIGNALFALKCRCELLPVFIVKIGEEKYKLSIDKPLRYTLTGDNDRDIEEITQKTSDIIAKYVKLYPEQWFIFDNPWKNA